MYSKADIGKKVYLPQWGEKPCEVYQWREGWNMPLVVRTPENTNYSFFEDGREYINSPYPVVSRTPWTQRAVTEKPWQPEVGEVVITHSSLVGIVSELMPHMAMVIIYEEGPRSYAYDKLRPFTESAARELLSQPSGEEEKLTLGQNLLELADAGEELLQEFCKGEKEVVFKRPVDTSPVYDLEGREWSKVMYYSSLESEYKWLVEIKENDKAFFDRVYANKYGETAIGLQFTLEPPKQ